MRILQLITQNQLRGAEVFAAQLSDALVERGHEVILAAAQGNEQVLSVGPRVRYVALGGTQGGRLPLSRSVRRNLRRLLYEFDPDIVQANGSETLKYAALLKRRKSRPAVVYRNISVMSMWSGSGVKRRVVAAALKRMDHVASVTKVGERDLVEGFGLPPDRVSVIPIGVPIPPALAEEERQAMRRGTRSEFGLPPECPLVVHVGSFTPEKNHKELIEAFAHVVAGVPEARLLLVGDGPLRVAAEGQVEAVGLGSAVTFAGAVADAARVIAAADVLALPSLREGLPGVILEAGAARVPTVAYDVGGVGEVVEDGVTGLLVAKGDVAGMAAGLVQLVSKADQREALGHPAREHVAAGFGLGAVVERFESLYVSLGHPADG